MQNNLSAIILTKNEEKNIIDCLDSVRFCEEIIVVDDESEDRTADLVKNYHDKKVKFYTRPIENDFSAQRNFSLSKASNEWVLYLDSDERISANLVFEIQNAIRNTDTNGFFLKRNDVIWGKQLKFGEAGSMYLLRLARKKAGEWHGKVHEEWVIDGRVEKLTNPIIHYPHQTLREFLSEINVYSSLRAEELYVQNKHSNLFSIVFYPKAKFFMNYFLKQGFRDGTAGLIFALMMSFHSFLVRAKLYLIGNNK